VVHEGGVAVQLAATPGRVSRLTVPGGVSMRDLGHVLVGRQRAHSGELVVDGRLLPEQREAVNRIATLISLDQDVPLGPVEDEVLARAHVAALTRHRRRAFVEKTLTTMHELERALSDGPGGGTGDDAAAIRAAILEAASAIAGGAAVIVLTPPEQLAGVRDRELAESLAAELARRGQTVVLLGEADQTGGRGQPGREPASASARGSGPAQEHA
jgi:RND superfamily putative drug exporter